MILLGAVAAGSLFRRHARFCSSPLSNNLKRLVIANPSATDRGRIRAVFAQQLGSGALVRQYDDFHQFVDALPGCLE